MQAFDRATGRETLLTVPNGITLVRTIAAALVGMVGVGEQSLRLLLVSLVIYWIGDMADGAVARLMDQETRTGAVFDVVCDRLCAAVFYLGLITVYPDLTPAIAIYLIVFMVPDTYLSLAFLAWPVMSPNYFYEVDRRLWLWNWSKTGKALNSSIFAIVLLVTENLWLCLGIALVPLAVKSASVVRLARIGLPTPYTSSRPLAVDTH